MPGDLRTLRLPPLMASLVVSEDLVKVAASTDKRRWSNGCSLCCGRMAGLLACRSPELQQHTALDQVIQSARIPGSRLAQGKPDVVVARRGVAGRRRLAARERRCRSHLRLSGPPPGRRSASCSSAVRSTALPPFNGPVPRIAAGRMFLQVGSELYAADIYTGRHWRGSGRSGGPGSSSPPTASFYAISGLSVCLRLDPAKGEIAGHHCRPRIVGQNPGGWEEIRMAGDALLGIAGKHLVCVDRTSGQLRWWLDAEPRRHQLRRWEKYGLLRADYWLPRHRRRGDAKSEEGTIIAVDAGSGKVVRQICGRNSRRPSLRSRWICSLVSPQLAWCEASGACCCLLNDSTAAAYQGRHGKQLWAQASCRGDPPNARHRAASPPIVLSDCLVTHAGEVVRRPGDRRTSRANVERHEQRAASCGFRQSLLDYGARRSSLVLRSGRRRAPVFPRNLAAAAPIT